MIFGKNRIQGMGFLFLIKYVTFTTVEQMPPEFWYTSTTWYIVIYLILL